MPEGPLGLVTLLQDGAPEGPSRGVPGKAAPTTPQPCDPEPNAGVGGGAGGSFVTGDKQLGELRGVLEWPDHSPRSSRLCSTTGDHSPSNIPRVIPLGHWMSSVTSE